MVFSDLLVVVFGGLRIGGVLRVGGILVVYVSVGFFLGLGFGGFCRFTSWVLVIY